MAHVGVREEDAVGRPASGERVDLIAKVRGGVEQVRAPAGAVHQPQTRHFLGAPLPGANGRAESLLAVEVRDAGILRDPQHHQLPIGATLSLLAGQQRTEHRNGQRAHREILTKFNRSLDPRPEVEGVRRRDYYVPAGSEMA